MYVELADTAGAVDGTGYWAVPGNGFPFAVIGRNSSRGIEMRLVFRHGEEDVLEGEVTSATSMSGRIKNGVFEGGTFTLAKQP